jgi:OH-DDVA meta-cleavage compound hydrolase
MPGNWLGSLPVIIDCHGHVSPPAQLWTYKASIMSHRGAHGRKMPPVSDEDILFYANKREMAPCGHLDMLDNLKIDRQLISPRPFQMAHSVKPGKVVHWFTEETNNIIHRTVTLMPDRLRACPKWLEIRLKTACRNWNVASAN